MDRNTFLQLAGESAQILEGKVVTFRTMQGDVWQIDYVEFGLELISHELGWNRDDENDPPPPVGTLTNKLEGWCRDSTGMIEMYNCYRPDEFVIKNLELVAVAEPANARVLIEGYPDAYQWEDFRLWIEVVDRLPRLEAGLLYDTEDYALSLKAQPRATKVARCIAKRGRDVIFELSPPFLSDCPCCGHKTRADKYILIIIESDGSGDACVLGTNARGEMIGAGGVVLAGGVVWKGKASSPEEVLGALGYALATSAGADDAKSQG